MEESYYFGFFWDLRIDNFRVFLLKLEKAVLTDSPRLMEVVILFKSKKSNSNCFAALLAECTASVERRIRLAELLDLSQHRLLLDVAEALLRIRLAQH